MARRMTRSAKIRQWMASPTGQRITHATPAAMVFAVAAYQSYWHIATVAGRAGETPVTSHLMPFSVDGLMVCAARYITHARTTSGKAISFIAFVFGVTATLAANIMAANPNVVDRLVAVWPAVAMVWTAAMLHWGEMKAKAKPRVAKSPANVVSLKATA